MAQIETVAALDVGSSSVRTLLFDREGRALDGFGMQIPYQIDTAADGGAEADADYLADLCTQALATLYRQCRERGTQPCAVAFDTFWHNLLGVDESGHPTTKLLHVFDTRSRNAAHQLAGRIDGKALHRRTGCVLHPSYWPAKLQWLAESQPHAFQRTQRWLSIGEYLYLKLFGRPGVSSSMLSGTGLWNQRANNWDQEIIRLLPVELPQLADLTHLDQPCQGLLPPYQEQWPEWNAIPWFPALGDGACDNIGSGCASHARFALMVGTSGALRVVLEADAIEIPEGLWCYRVDSRRYVLGGALSDGGDVYAWMKHTLALPSDDAEIEKLVAAIPPGSHGLTLLPLFAGERSPHWRAEARAAITGLSLHTTAAAILRAALESVALRFRAIYELLRDAAGVPAEVVASGGALLHSPSWTRMMADSLGHTVLLCLEKEATSRGAALLAFERLGLLARLTDAPPRMGAAVSPEEQAGAVYRREYESQNHLYRKLYEES